MQLEWLTGGECLAGMHEVVVTKRTLDAIKLAQQQNHSLWRVSSTVSLMTLFCWRSFAIFCMNTFLHSMVHRFMLSLHQLFAHIASDATLKPLGHFADSALAGEYPPILAGEYVEQELAVINLKEKKAKP